MSDFELVFDDETIAPQQNAEFSLEFDDNQPDFMKVKRDAIEASKSPIDTLSMVAKNIFGMVSSSSMVNVNEGVENAARNVVGGIVENKDIVGQYVKELPKAIIGTGMKLGEKAKNIKNIIADKIETSNLYEFHNDKISDVVPELAKGFANEAMVTTPKIVSDMAYWVGTNMKDQTGKKSNALSDGFLRISETMRNISEYMGDVDLLKSKATELPDGSFSYGQISNLLGHGLGQGAVMVTLARILGPKVAYGFYSGAGGAEMFKESYEKEGDLGKANTLGTINAASTYMIDRWFDPLPENIASGARMTAKQVVKEVGKTAVKDPLSEGTQKVLSENLVRKIGIDAEQDLYEGVVEEMIGALGGAAAMGGGAIASAYSAERHYQEAKERAVELGADPNDVEQYKRATLAKLQQHPEAFDTVFQQNVEKTLQEIDTFVKENGDTEEVRKAMQTKADLDEVYNRVYEQIKTKDNDKVASAQAKVVQGVALWGAQELGISPLEYFEQRFPTIEKIAYRDFARRINKAKKAGEKVEINLYEALKNPKLLRGTRKKDNRISLTQFLKNNGGLVDAGGELKSRDASKQVIGLINNKSGIDFDDAALAAWEAGYFPNKMERPTINEFLDAIDDELRGNKKYASELEGVDLEQEVADLSEELDRADIDWRNMEPKEIEMAVDAYLERQRAYDEAMNQEDDGDNGLAWFQRDAIDLANKINNIDAERLAFGRKDINPELKGRENEVVKAVVINRFFADKKASKDIKIDDVIAKIDETVKKNENGVRVLKNSVTGETATLSNAAIRKMFDTTRNREDAQNIGGILGKECIANIKDIFDSALLIKTHDDKKHGSKNKIRRYANVIHSDGENFIVKLTIKEMADNRNELTDIEIEGNNGRDLATYDLKVGKKNTAEGNTSVVTSEKTLPPALPNGNDIIIDDLIEFVNTYTEKTININGVERPTTNSNGDRIAKTVEGLQAFYEWFGDSKVVDEQGRPLVVYHGTNTEFDSFDKKLLGTTTLAYSAKQGFFFTDSEEVANSYGDYAAIYQPINELRKKQEMAERWGDWDNVDELTIKIEELDRKISQTPANERGQKIYPVYLKADNVLEYDAKGEYFSDIGDEINNVLLKAKNQGKDGVVLKNLKDQPLVFDEKEANHFVVFEPNQIKSTSNIGTYSESDNIYFQSAFAGSPVDYDRPSLEAIGSGEGNQAHGYGLYYALDREVAEGYRERSFSRKKFTEVQSLDQEFNKVLVRGQPLLEVYDVDIDRNLLETLLYKPYGVVEAELEKRIDQWTEFLNKDDYPYKKYAKDKIDAYTRLKDDLFNNGMSLIKQDLGQVHEVDIPENPYLLDEDLTFNEQPEFVKEKLKEVLMDDAFSKFFDDWGSAEEFAKVELDDYNQGMTGGNIYDRISDMLGSDREASTILEKHGIKGITYVGDIDGRCFVIFNPDDVKVIQKFYQDGADMLYRDPKGAFSQRINHRALISLFERADASTFMHETAHFFFEELKAFAKTSKKSAEMLDTINKWLGYDGVAYTEAQIEQFARGFEQYLREGKAPSKYLKRVFDAFMSWMRNLYKTARELNVQLNDDVRSVYANILGGTELDKYMDLSPAEVLGSTKKYWKAKREAMDEIYAQNNQAKKAERRLFGKVGQSMQKVYDGMRDYLSDAIVPLEEEIKQISPDLYNMNRRLEIGKLQKTSAYYRRIKGFVEGMNKMNEADFHTFDLALKNRDVDTVDRLLTKYELHNGFAEVRRILDDLREQMIDVGVDVAYMPDYFPRKIKDADGLLDYVEQEFGDRQEYSIIQKMIEEKRKDGRIRTKEDEAQIVNSLIRGYAGGISIAKIGNVKERSIDVIDQHMNKYYKVSSDALVDYISGAVQMIENKKYFGRETKELQNLRRMVANRETTIFEYEAMEPQEAKWKEIKTRNYKIGAVEAQIRNTYDNGVKAELTDRKTKLEAEVEYLKDRRADQVKEIAITRMKVELAQVKKEVDALADSKIENSVGNLLLEMAEQGKISHTQELRLKELLLARFSNKGLGNEFLRIIRDGGYIWTLGNFESAITQFGDLGTSAYKNGLWNTAFEYVKAWSGKSEITIEDLGLGKIIQDGGYADTSAWSQALDKVLKYTGFEKMDKIAKQTLVNSAIRKAREQAKAESPELEQYLRHEFGEKWVDVKEDMKTGAITDEILEYAMFQLLDVQPITIDQMPRYYAEGGKQRMFYMMKSYFIKQLNEYRKVCFETAKTNPGKAVVDMLRLTAYLMLFNAGADLLKDLLFGRPINVADTLVDNIFIGGSINRYMGMNIKRKGLGWTLQEQLLFPVAMDELIVDVLGDKDVKDWNAWKNIPLVGRPYYWWFGGGHLKTEKEIKKQRNQRRNQRRRRRED